MMYQSYIGDVKMSFVKNRTGFHICDDDITVFDKSAALSKYLKII
jgi:hypothetical protein